MKHCTEIYIFKGKWSGNLGQFSLVNDRKMGKNLSLFFSACWLNTLSLCPYFLVSLPVLTKLVENKTSHFILFFSIFFQSPFVHPLYALFHKPPPAPHPVATLLSMPMSSLFFFFAHFKWFCWLKTPHDFFELNDTEMTAIVTFSGRVWGQEETHSVICSNCGPEIF